MNFHIKYWSLNLITWQWGRGKEWLNFPSREDGNVIFPGFPDSLYDEKVLAGCERNSVSFQGIQICLPNHSRKGQKGPEVPVSEAGGEALDAYRISFYVLL